MGLCSFSSSLIMDGTTSIDNAFINEFLPKAQGDYVKVYLYGLSQCSNPYSDDNSLSSMAIVLKMSEDQILDAFSYWQDMGIVQIISTDPVEVRYLPIKTHSGSAKLRVKSQYDDFNKQVQQIISGRMIRPNEYNEYYHLIESYHFEPEALIMIIKYCTTIKSTSVNYPYILTVARSYEQEGIKSAAALEEKFLEQERAGKEIKEVLSALGLKREADLEERNMYLKWTNTYGFSHGTILEVAKLQKNKGGFAKLDETLKKYAEQKLFSMQDISEYNQEKEQMYTLARDISKTIGLYYQNLESVVDTYITDWLQKGYDSQTLQTIASYCFKQSIRTLEGVNSVICKFFKLGLVSIQSINEYIQGLADINSKIREVLDACNISRLVNTYDRDFYNTWTNDWGFSQEAILLVAASCNGKAQPIQYLNKVLATLHAEKISSLDEIKKRLATFANQTSTTKPAANNYQSREYKKEELNALFDSLDTIEV